MTVQVLISCMYQKGAEIIRQSNIQSDVIVINQCDENRREEFSFLNKKGEECKAIVIYTTERGLSRSRNMALSLATGDICIISDDDETFTNDYVDHIRNTYKRYPEYGMIFFEIGNRLNGKRGYRQDIVITKLKTLSLCSVQITFKRKKITDKAIKFNTNFGAGISLAGGEEHLFMFECLDKGIKCRNYPYEMAKLNPNSASTWRLGYSRDFIIDEGKVLKALFGKYIASVIALRYLWKKRKWITANGSLIEAFISINKGIWS